jgi:hypothetical protein
MQISTYDTKTIDEINFRLPKELIFSEGFNDYIDNLPICVEKLIFGLGTKKNKCGYGFENLIIKEKLFNDFDSLSKFNNNSINNLPNTVKWIIFPCESTFNIELKTLPDCLEILSLGRSYSKKLNNLPPSLKYFFCFMPNFYSNITSIPTPINSIAYNIKSIPDTIEFIGIITNNIKSLEIIPQKTKLFKICSLSSSKVVPCDIGNVSDFTKKLPEYIEKLIMDCNFYSEIKFLPNNLKKLKISQLNNLDILSKLPDYLEELDIRFQNMIIPNDFTLTNSNLPCNLKKLSIDYKHVQLTHKTSFLNLGCLPDSLELLSIKNNLEKTILDDLPCGLRYLKIESILLDSDKDDIDIFANLPRSLEKLLIVIYPYNSSHTKPIIKLTNLPRTISEIVVFSKLNYKLDSEYPNLIIHHFDDTVTDYDGNYNKKYIQFDEIFF